MTWKLLVVMACLTAHSVRAMDMDLIADAFSLIGALLELLANVGTQGSTGGATSSGRAECTTPDNTTDACDYYKQTEACSKLVKCGICTRSGSQSQLDSYCATACTKFKNDVYMNGEGDYKAVCKRSFDACYCNANK